MPARILLSLLAIVTIPAASAQVRSEFDVASVKPNKLNDRLVTIDVGPGGLFNARGYTVKLLIQRAYGVMGWNISGGPGWLDNDRFDVSAKATVPGNLTEKQLQPMLRALLADRFKLKLHEAAKEIDGYALVVARSGPKVKPSAQTEEHPDTFRLNATGLTGQAISMPDFARYVGGKLGLIVVDKTGLNGLYDTNAKWTVDTDEPTGGAIAADPREALKSAVFTALQEQLGLKIAAQKITIQTLVIDSVEKASAN